MLSETDALEQRDQDAGMLHTGCSRCGQGCGENGMQSSMDMHGCNVVGPGCSAAIVL